MDLTPGDSYPTERFVTDSDTRNNLEERVTYNTSGIRSLETMFLTKTPITNQTRETGYK